MIEISKIHYPSLNRILAMDPNPEILLGRRIFWEEKLDGSNVGGFINKEGNIVIRSRNMDRASEDFQRIFLEAEGVEKVKEMLISMRDEWDDGCVVFGELLVKGRSPTRIQLHDKHKFVVFDIWSAKTDGFLPYMSVLQYCQHFGLPMVELYGCSQHTTLDSLLEYRDLMLEVAKQNGREGVVGKTFENGTMYVYFKEKRELPNLRRSPKGMKTGNSLMPSLPESEILGALDKVLVDLGTSDFKDVRKAMPMFVKYVGEESRKHHCRKPKGTLFTFYKAKLEEMN